jgi:hypothetical protein
MPKKKKASKKPPNIGAPFTAKKTPAKKGSPKMTAARRRDLPADKMGLPELGKYPVDTPKRAGAAKARVSGELKKGNVTPTQAKKVVSKADKALPKAKKGSKRKGVMAMIGAAKKGSGKMPPATKAARKVNPAMKAKKKTAKRRR